ncbi:MAG: tetrahydrofolate synthase [Treponema sp.]|nr:tetrahydrofolate synthase [Treponema sp.]
MFRNSGDVYSWLCGFINLEQGSGSPPAATAEHFKLERMRILAGLADHPERSAPAIHIAGSKGKGSVTAMICAILEAAGEKTARYLSPHVSDWRERISGGGGFFSEALYLAAGRELHEIHDKYRNRYAAAGKSKGGSVPGGATFFELCTLYFFLCARLARSTMMIVETGLGGRLDATNIMESLVSVITPIEKEHTAYLGNSLEGIAREKAGILKNGRPLVSSEQVPEVRSVLCRTAKERGSPFFYLPDCYAAEDIRIHPEGTDFILRDISSAPAFLGLPLSLSVPGRVQAQNAALAVLAIRTAAKTGFAVSKALDPANPSGKAALRRGLTSFSLPARFERFRGGPSEPALVIDGAHTAKSAGLCAETFCSLYGEGGILLFGCAADKDAAAMAAVLVRRFSRCVITGTGNFRAARPEAVYRTFKAASEMEGPGLKTVVLVPDPTAALAEALRAGRENSLPVLCCGSFYLAAEIRNSLEKKDMPARPPG